MIQFEIKTVLINGEETKLLIADGIKLAYYEIEGNKLFLHVLAGYNEDQCVNLIQELENKKFNFLSYLNIEKP
jgi:hypothetical protein